VRLEAAPPSEDAAAHPLEGEPVALARLVERARDRHAAQRAQQQRPDAAVGHDRHVARRECASTWSTAATIRACAAAAGSQPSTLRSGSAKKRSAIASNWSGGR
jgi:hypothetical protein